MLWETISNAFQNSREVTSVGFPLSLIQPLHCHLFLNGCDTPFCPVTVCLTSWNTARMSDLNLPNDTPYHMMLCSAVNLRERMKRVVTVFVFPSKRYVCWSPAFQEMAGSSDQVLFGLIAQVAFAFPFKLSSQSMSLLFFLFPSTFFPHLVGKGSEQETGWMFSCWSYPSSEQNKNCYYTSFRINFQSRK